MSKKNYNVVGISQMKRDWLKVLAYWALVNFT